MTQRPDWNTFFLLQAKLAAVRSTCNSRPQGAVLVRDHRVLAGGYNGALPGQEHCLGRESECSTCQGEGTWLEYVEGIPVWNPTCPNCQGTGKIPYCRRRATNTPDSMKDRACVSAHAEANAIAQAALIGVSIRGSTLYCTTKPCAPCAKLLVQSGVVKVYYELDYDDEGDGWLSDILPMERLEVSPEALAAAMEVLQPGTSRRRMGRTG